MDSGAAASSKTYRKVVNQLSEAIGQEPEHTNSPLEDFEGLVGEIAELADQAERFDQRAVRKRLINWYKRGIRRGYITACDALIRPEGELSLKEDTLFFNAASTTIRVRMKIDGKWIRKKFQFSSEDLEFEDKDE